MNVKLLIGALIVLILAGPSVRAQDGGFVAGLSPVYNLPIGSLHDRFNGSVGGMVFFGKQISSEWTWIGKCEYFELTKVNSGKLIKTVNIQENGVGQQYRVPLTKLSMKFKAVGFTAEAMLNILRGTSLETNVHAGFGFYYWDNFRSAYYDSLFVVSAISGSMLNVANLAVPENRQSDWSGSVNIGGDLNLKAVDPVWLTLGADYRLIVGELWQALDLDMESVSVMQSISFRAGISVRF